MSWTDTCTNCNATRATCECGDYCSYSKKIKQNNMTQLQIAEKLREQIKEQWPYVSTILVLYENNIDGIFTDRIQSMVDKLLPGEVFYQMNSIYKAFEMFLLPQLIKNDGNINPILSLPINIVLFGSEDNPLGILKH